MKKLLLLIPVISLAIYLFSQSTVLTKSTILTKTTKMGAVNVSRQVTIIRGGDVASSVPDNGNANQAFATPFSTPVNCGSCTVSTMGIYIPASAASGVHGSAIYTDNGNTPVGGTLVCGGSSTVTPTNASWNVNVSGYTNYCNGQALLANTEYWAMSYTDNATEEQGTTDTATSAYVENCPFQTKGSYETSGTITPWPTTFPAINAGGNGCYTTIVEITYSTTDPYVIVQTGGWVATTQPATIQMAPVLSGDSFFVAANPSTSAAPTISVVDTTGGTISGGGSTVDTLTKRGTCPLSSGNAFQNCIYSIDQATAGVNGITITYTIGGGGNHNNNAFVEINGTKSSSSFDSSAYDTAQITSGPSFTSANTLSTANPTELLIGMVHEEIDCSAHTCTFSGSNGWTNLFSTQNDSASQFPTGLFYQTVTTTGTYGLSGSIVGGTGTYQAVPGLAAFK